MSSYRVLSTLDHDGKRYAPGRKVDLDTEQAGPLVALGVIESANAAPAGAEPQALTDAIAAMLAEDPDKQRAEWWTRDGAPETRALSERVGARVSAEARDAAWAAASA